MALGQGDLGAVQVRVDDDERVAVAPCHARAQHLERAVAPVRPAVVRHGRALGGVPRQIGDRVTVMGGARGEAVGTQNRVGLAQGDQPGDGVDLRLLALGQVPVDP